MPVLSSDASCKAENRKYEAGVAWTELPAIQDPYRQSCGRTTEKVISDSGHKMFTFLPSGRHTD